MGAHFSGYTLWASTALSNVVKKAPMSSVSFSLVSFRKFGPISTFRFPVVNFSRNASYLLSSSHSTHLAILYFLCSSSRHSASLLCSSSHLKFSSSYRLLPPHILPFCISFVPLHATRLLFFAPLRTSNFHLRIVFSLVSLSFFFSSLFVSTSLVLIPSHVFFSSFILLCRFVLPCFQ